VASHHSPLTNELVNMTTLFVNTRIPDDI